MVLTSWDGRSLCLDRLYVRAIIGGQVLTSNTLTNRLIFCEAAGGRRVVTDCDGYNTYSLQYIQWVLQTSPISTTEQTPLRSESEHHNGKTLVPSMTIALEGIIYGRSSHYDCHNDAESFPFRECVSLPWCDPARPDWTVETRVTRLDQGVTNVCGGKIFLKQFPADTAQWGLSLPAIVCISIQLLASCTHTTPHHHQYGNIRLPLCLTQQFTNKLPPRLASCLLSSHSVLTQSSLLTPQPAGFTEFSLFCSLRIHEVGLEGLSIAIIDDKN